MDKVQGAKDLLWWTNVVGGRPLLRHTALLGRLCLFSALFRRYVTPCLIDGVYGNNCLCLCRYLRGTIGSGTAF